MDPKITGSPRTSSRLAANKATKKKEQPAKIHHAKKGGEKDQGDPKDETLRQYPSVSAAFPPVDPAKDQAVFIDIWIWLDEKVTPKQLRILSLIILLLFTGSMAFILLSPTSAVNEPRFRAVIMVKNEEQILPRLFTSLKHTFTSLDGIVLCDTGSTDNTIKVATEQALSHGWKLKVELLEPFVNFETSRNACRQRVRDEDDWLILLDADFTTELNTNHYRQVLETPTYDVNTIQIHATMSGHPHNSLPLLVHSNAFVHRCRYRLWTHEFLDCKNVTSGFYNGFQLRDHADGQSRPEKLERDISLLKQWIDENGSSETDIVPRALYYLARAYEDNGDIEQAVQTYQRHDRVQLMTNYQFYSRYRQAMIEMKRPEPNVTLNEEKLHQAFGTYDGVFRREPVYYLTRLYRLKEDFDRCIIYGLAGMNLPLVDYERMPLFLEPVIYDWVLEEELAFCYYKKFHFKKALRHFERVKYGFGHRLDHASQQRLAEEIDACTRGMQQK